LEVGTLDGLQEAKLVDELVDVGKYMFDRIGTVIFGYSKTV